MTRELSGAKGGNTTRERHGAEHYKRIGKEGGEKLAAERGPEYFRELSRKAADARRQRRHQDDGP